MDNSMNTQRICASEPFCLCAGGPNEWDECDCFADAMGERCAYCRALMEMIDFETGEVVGVATV